MLRTLDLFSGIGGFSLGLERTHGFKTVAFCEIEPFARRVLAKHWPEVPCYDDVRWLKGTPSWLTTGGQHIHATGRIDVICGGFPCQDISFAGTGAGIDGDRSGLWREFSRLIGEIRPRYVIVENSSALLSRGIERVFGDLAALGFDAEWSVIPASYVGAPHRRDRTWIVAYSDRLRLQERIFGCFWPGASKPPKNSRGRFGYPVGTAWNSEPELALLVHGVPDELAAAHALGNAVVPQIPELIGRAILAAEAQRQQEAA